MDDLLFVGNPLQETLPPPGTHPLGPLSFIAEYLAQVTARLPTLKKLDGIDTSPRPSLSKLPETIFIAVLTQAGVPIVSAAGGDGDS